MRYNEDEPEMGLRGREFWCHLYNLPITLRLRDLKTIKVGRLCALSGTVTRTSEVRPELIYGTFQCLDCNAEIRSTSYSFFGFSFFCYFVSADLYLCIDRRSRTTIHIHTT